MTDGASPSVHRTVEMLTRSPNDAFLTPIPQYPLYSASLALHGAHLLPYYLDEEHSWGLDMEHLRSQCVQVRHPILSSSAWGLLPTCRRIPVICMICIC